jgi:flagellin
MIIKHSIAAMNANRQLNETINSISMSSEKLSSGYKINIAADDAAGLAISEKMRKQIRGLTQSSLNAEDGISLMQVADGAMAEIQDMLDRGVELSIKAANGTLSDSDRANIQDEINQISTEIDSIKDRTKFNEIYVLKGQTMYISKQTGTELRNEGSLASWIKTGASITNGELIEEYKTTETYTEKIPDPNDSTKTINATSTTTVTHSAASIDFSGLTASNIYDLVGTGFNTTCCTCNIYYSIQFTDDTKNEQPAKNSSGKNMASKAYIYKIGIGGIDFTSTNPSPIEQLMDRIISGTENGNPNSHYTKLAVDSKNPYKLWIYDLRSNKDEATTKPNSGANFVSWNEKKMAYGITPSKSLNRGLFGDGYMKEYPVYETVLGCGAQDLSIQAGADTSSVNKIFCKLPCVSSEVLGINGISVTTMAGADDAVDIFSAAKDMVSAFRSTVGAYQNRLEYTIKNLDNIIENTTASESEIRDTDMASEMVKFSNQSIVAQAGQAMLANANQTQQEVLTLLD